MKNQSLVEKLEILLEKARAGEIDVLHYYATKSANRGAHWGYVGMNGAELCSAAVAAQKQASDALHEGTTDDELRKPAPEERPA